MMGNIVRVKDFTYNDLKEYVNKRCCDGEWGFYTSLYVLDLIDEVPKGKKKKKDEYVKEHIGKVFNLEKYPNMSINIDTGEIYKE